MGIEGRLSPLNRSPFFSDTFERRFAGCLLIQKFSRIGIAFHPVAVWRLKLGASAYSTFAVAVAFGGIGRHFVTSCDKTCCNNSSRRHWSNMRGLQQLLTDKMDEALNPVDWSVLVDEGIVRHRYALRVPQWVGGWC